MMTVMAIQIAMILIVVHPPTVTLVAVEPEVQFQTMRLSAMVLMCACLFNTEFQGKAIVLTMLQSGKMEPTRTMVGWIVYLQK